VLEHDGEVFHAAKATHDGVLSAVLAESGFNCVDDAIEAPRGLLALYTSRANPRRLRPGAGRHPLLDDGFKPCPAGR
jgi:2-methylcitrate dehydratase PrpD